MGDPKKQRKKYDTPRFPWQIDALEAELKLLGQYGLRNKREIWRALDDVLDLALEDILGRRLQTLVFQRGLAKSIQQSRQLITHGHIVIEGRRVSSPSYLVLKDEETKITYTPKSPLTNPDHPLTKSITVPTEPVSQSKEKKSHE